MIIRLKRAIGAFILASTLLTTVAGCQHLFSAAHAATYYVDTTGSNSNPGTEKSPWGTIAYAADQMAPGDTTYVRGRVYNETQIRFRRPGISAAPIRLLNYPNESPIIHFTGQTASHRILIQHANGYNLAMGWITIEGFEIRNGYEGIKAYNLHDSTIRKNWIHDNVMQGLLIQGSTRVLIDRNIINHNGPFSTNPTSDLEHGIYMNGTAATITNNVIYDNTGFGIQQNGASHAEYSATRHAGPEFGPSHDWVIANNTFAYNGRAGMVVWGPKCNNVRIENNIFYENGSNGGRAQGVTFTARTYPTGVTIRNNHFFTSRSFPTAAVSAEQPPSFVYANNIINVSDPAFANAPATLPASPNFSLTARSSAIDKGLPPSNETPNKTHRTALDDALLKARHTDFAGTTRPQGRAYDIGAYEYSAGNDAQSPTTPAGLQVD